MTILAPALPTSVHFASLQHQLDELRAGKVATTRTQAVPPLQSQLRVRNMLNDQRFTAKMTPLGVINLSLGIGHLGAPENHDIPDSISFVVGMFLREVSRALPGHACVSDDWRELIPLVLNTDSESDSLRLGVMLEWLWGTVFPRIARLNPRGSGPDWRAASVIRTGPAVRHACRSLYGKHSISTAMRRFDYGLELCRRASKSSDPNVVSHHSGYATRALINGVTELVCTLQKRNLVCHWDDFDPAGQLLRHIDV